MTAQLLEQLITRHGVALVNSNNLSEFLQRHSQAVVFFAGNPDRYPETSDVACVLPEIIRQFPQLAGALVAEQEQETLQRRFDFTVWPSLAFFRDTHYLGAISGIQNWDDYVIKIPQIMATDPLNLLPVVQA